MAQDRLAENLKIFESETDMRLSNLSKQQVPFFLSGLFYAAHGYFRFTSLGDGGMTVFERQMFVHEVLLWAYGTAVGDGQALERAPILLTSARDGIFQSHDAAATLQFRLQTMAFGDSPVSEQQKLSALDGFQRARWLHLRDLAEVEADSVSTGDLKANENLSNELRRGVAAFRKSIADVSRLSGDDKHEYLSGLFWGATSYFRYTHRGLMSMFERQMFMHRLLQLVIKRCRQKKLDIEVEFDGAMQLAIAPVFHAHFSASNMMLMSGAEPLTSAQTKEMQRLTDAYTAYLPSRVTHVG